MKVLIVGGGVSGICLTHQLLSEGHQVSIIDSGKNFSSVIAAGMINPMVFRKMVKTWRGDDLIPYLIPFYKSMEKKVGARFFFSRKIRRVFATEVERKLWITQTQNPDYKEYIASIDDTPQQPDYVKGDFGSGWVKSPGYVDARRFMEANHSFFKTHKLIHYEAFDFNSFNPKEGRYKKEVYDKVVFAEGYKGKENPFFGYLPLQQTKGEVLTIQSKEIHRTEILNRKCFVLPTEDGLFRLGATFKWDTDNPEPTNAAKEQLLEQYNLLSKADVEIIDQEGGIRPTVTDRRPLIGVHPTYSNCYIFNGMGTKGYMIAPYFSAHFTDYLTKKVTLDPEVDIQRFYKKHYTPPNF